MPKVLITSPTFGIFVKEPLKLLEEEGCELTRLPPEEKATEELIAHHAREAHAVIVGVEPIGERVFDAARKLKVVSKHGVGVDNVNLEEATRRRVVVANAPGTNNEAVADFTFALMLSISRRIPYLDRTTKHGEWKRVVGSELWAKCLGVVGLGAIGRRVARRAKGFEMKVVAHDIVEDRDYASREGIQYLPLEELLGEADYVSLHLPLTEATRGLIGERELRLMKPTSFLISTCRGGVVDEGALYRALKEGWIGGAASDVFLEEPPEGSPLLELDNFIATPHGAGYTQEALRAMGMVCAENVLRVLRGERPLHLVNPEVYREAEGG